MTFHRAEDLPVLIYALTDWEVTIENRGILSWAICHYGMVLSKSKAEFVYEPLPSNRDAAFLADTRFSNPQEALDHWNRCLPAIEGR